MGFFSALWALVRVMPLMGQLGLIAVIITTLGGTWYAVKSHYYRQGYEAHRQEVELADRAAAERAAKAISRRRACVDGGGVWDVERGECGGR